MKDFIKKNLTVVNVCIVLLCINLFVYIFVGAKSLINSDSAFIVDYANEMIKCGSLFPKTWINTNDFWVYSLIPMIFVFLKLGFSFFLSRQLAVLIQTIFLVILIYDLFKKQFEDKNGAKMVLLLILSGISGQVFFEMFADATYGSIVFFMILVFWLFIRFLKENKKIFLILLGVLLTLLTACSLRFPIYLSAPLICCLLYLFYDKGFQRKYIYIFIAIGLASGIGLLINKYLNNTLLISYAIEKTAVKTSTELSTGVFKAVFDYLWLCGATDLNVYSLTVEYRNTFILSTSPLIVLTFIRTIYAIVTISIPAFLFSKFKKMKENEKMLYIFTFSLTIIMIFFIVMAGMNYWYRYVTPFLIFLNFLYPMFFKYCFKPIKKNEIVLKVALGLFVITSIFFVTTSYFDIETKSLRKNYYTDIAEFLLEKDLHYGFTTPNETNLFSTLTNGDLRVLKLDSSCSNYQKWLISTDWVKDDYYDGKIFFMRKANEMSISNIEERAIETYQFNEYVIYVLNDISDVLLQLENYNNLELEKNYGK